MSHLKEGSRKPRWSCTSPAWERACAYSGSIEVLSALGRGQKPACFPKFTAGQWSYSEARGAAAEQVCTSSPSGTAVRAALRADGRLRRGCSAPASSWTIGCFIIHCSGTSRGTKITQCCNKTCQGLAKLWESSAWLWWEV